MPDADSSIVTDGAVYHIPDPKTPKVPKDPAMRVSVSTFPPLSRITKQTGRDVSFTAVLECPADQVNEKWEVAIWHNAWADVGDAWRSFPLRPCVCPDTLSSVNQQDSVLSASQPHHLPSGSQPDPLPSVLQPETRSTRRLYFRNTLRNVPRTFNFTVRFVKPRTGWHWMNELYDTKDGTIIVDSVGDDSLPPNLHDVLIDTDWRLKCTNEESQTPGTNLFTVAAAIEAAEGEKSTFKEFTLGLPFGGFLRWFSLIRIWSPWLAPRQGESTFSLTEDAILSTFMSTDGLHLAILAMSGKSAVSTVLRSDDEGRVILRARNDGKDVNEAVAAIAVGHDVGSAIAAVMYYARDLRPSLASSQPSPLPPPPGLTTTLDSGFHGQWVEEWFDGLGYCTWNALGQKLSEERILDALRQLKDNNICVSNLIIDDNWQDIDYKGPSQFQYGWKGFEAEPNKFPNGLKDLVTKIRGDFPGIEHVAVWHALLGYWGGIAAQGDLAQQYETQVVHRWAPPRRHLPITGPMTVIAKSDVSSFYNDFYNFLASCGIDGVKTDAQFMIDTWTSATVRNELIDEYVDAWHESATRHFGNKAISCMSQTPQIMLHSQIDKTGPMMVCRNSDDFFPNVPTSHPWHIWCNAHNTVLTQHLNVLPDWDMFQTVHDYSSFHAAARCVSGGPIYITDKPGEHNISLIKQMTAVTPRGRTVILRPSNIGKTADVYAHYEDETLLRVDSYHNVNNWGVPIMGIFNVAARSLTELVPLGLFRGVKPSLQYVVRAFSSNMITKPLMIEDAAATLVISLDDRGWEILAAHPLAAFHSQKFGATIYVASLGLLEQMTGAAAIIRVDFEARTNGLVCLKTTLKALGILGIYVSALPQMSLDDDFTCLIHGRHIPSNTASIDPSSPNCLRLDIQTAWEQMELTPGWSNEVVVELLFHIGA